MDQVAEIKQKTDIVDVIGSFIPLKKAGRNYKANCPFHGEKTPSFMVSPELQIYKCFGCGANGDTFTFLENYEKMEFAEALEYLAQKAGVTLIKTTPTGESKDIYYNLNLLTAKYYSYMLLTHPIGRKALKYLTEERGLKLDTIKFFNLGFAPGASKTLFDFLTVKKKIKPEILEKGGLMYKSQHGFIDRFNGRIVFPLSDHRGNIVGFSGRLLPWDARTEVGKYINSPETPVYHKSDILYGLNLSRDEIKTKNEAIVVEGELDLISSWQAGFKNMVAIKGTALTEGHVHLLKRFTGKIILSLDADLAGDAAARRGIALAFNQGLDVRVVEIKNYKDPDEIVRANPALFQSLLDASRPVWDFLIDSVFNKYDLTNTNEKAKVSHEVTPIAASIEDKIMQAHYINLIAKKMDVPLEAVSEEIERTTPEFGLSKSKDEKIDFKPKNRKDLLEEEMISLLLQQKDLALFTDEKTKNLITGHATRRIFEEIQKHKNNFDLTAFSRELSPELMSIFSEIVLTSKEYDDPEESQRDLDRVKKELITIKIKEELKEITQKMKSQEESGSSDDTNALTEKYTILSKTLVELEKNQ